MKTLILIFSLAVVIIVLAFWFVYVKAEKVPSSNDIKSLVIVYNKVSGDELISGNDELPPPFNIVSESEINHILSLVSHVHIRKLPLIDGTKTSNGEHWLINLNYKNGALRFIYVDRHVVSEIDDPESPIYVYLKNNFTQSGQY